MPTEVTFGQDGSELVIHATTSPPVGRCALLSALLASVVTVFGFSFVWLPALIIIALLTGAASFLRLTIRRATELRVSEFEMVSKSHADGHGGSVKRLLGQQIDYLEYQEDTDGPDSDGHPQGLYAVVGRRNICLLSELNEPQSAIVIDQIYEAFPAYRQRGQSRSCFGRDVASLDLSGPG